MAVVFFGKNIYLKFPSWAGVLSDSKRGFAFFVVCPDPQFDTFLLLAENIQKTNREKCHM